MKEMLLAHAKAGDGDAMEKLALLGREQGSMEESHQWLMKAAEAGQSNAMVMLADDFMNGNGCAKDAAMGVEWYKQAARLGCLAATEVLMKMWEEGADASPDGTDIPSFLWEVLRRECIDIYSTSLILRVRAFGSRREDEYLPLHERALEFRRINNRLQKLMKGCDCHEG